MFGADATAADATTTDATTADTTTADTTADATMAAAALEAHSVTNAASIAMDVAAVARNDSADRLGSVERAASKIGRRNAVDTSLGRRRRHSWVAE